MKKRAESLPLLLFVLLRQVSSFSCSTSERLFSRQKQHRNSIRIPSKLGIGHRFTKAADELLNDTEGDQTSRRLWLSGILVFAGTALGTPEEAFALPWQATPVNKRTGVTLFDAESSGYKLNFITYLSRFLLTFDADCRSWWYKRGASDIPKTAGAQTVQDYRNGLFAAFSASVELGLQDFEGNEGPSRLFNALIERYANAKAETKQEDRERREARRQICLLFGILEKNQPVQDLSRQLAAIEDAGVERVEIRNPGSGYAPGYGPPEVRFPPPDAGEGYETATGRAVLSPSGKLLRVDVVNRGAGYIKAPNVTIAPPAALRFRGPDETNAAEAAEAKAILFRSGPNKGKIERIQLTEPGDGYREKEIIRIRINPPETPPQEGGVPATATAVLEYQVSEIKILSNGTGYAVERPLLVTVEPPPLTARVNLNDPLVSRVLQPATSIPDAKFRKRVNNNSTDTISSRAKAAAGRAANCVGRECYDQPVVAIAYPYSKSNSYFRSIDNKDNNPRIVTGAVAAGELPESINFVNNGANEMLALLPAGVGLQFNQVEKRYELAVDPNYQENVPLWQQTRERRKIDPDFGPRGRAPIERDMSLDVSSFLRFMLSGAICCSGVHLALTPIDVVKTKVQTDPKNYVGLAAFKKVFNEGGISGMFRGWAPTFLGFFIWGGISYALTELIRRTATEALGAESASLEVPIILFSSALGAVVGSFVLCPFESVRIRSVSQKNFAPNVWEVFQRMKREEGMESLFAAIPVFLTKEIPFAMAKFTVFDLSQEWIYQQFPAAKEVLQLSLLVSLFSGTLGGIAASVVSNPADVTISTMKKAKTDMGAVSAAKMVLEQGGPNALFTGLPLRMIFYSLLVSLQFLVYDSVRFALGIGADDLKLYLNVLGGALTKTNISG